jgi:hypothetical protein
LVLNGTQIGTYLVNIFQKYVAVTQGTKQRPAAIAALPEIHQRIVGILKALFDMEAIENISIINIFMRPYMPKLITF